jgi:acetyl-CoA C-acetyltransferase
MEDAVIVSACRTPIGTMGGVYADMPAVQLGGVAVQEAIRRAGIDPETVEEVLMGNVLQAGLGQNPARQAAIGASLPTGIPSMTVNKVCGSGLKTVALAAQAVRLGDAEVVVAGGMENMTRAPYLMDNGRYGYRLGHGQLVDVMIRDGLWCAFDDCHMGITAENVANEFEVSRADQDAFAAESQRKAGEAMASGRFGDEIVPVPVKKRKETVTVEVDEHPRPQTTAESLAALRAAFDKAGSVTAGNASGINDGAAFMLVTRRHTANERGLPVAGRLVSYAVAGVDPAYMGMGMLPATHKALERAGLSLDDIDVFEVNEAFASVAVAVGRELGIPEDKLNPVGGAIALGHPIGASGAVLAVKLLHELARRNARYGLATLCIGGGMGIAAIFERTN